jgi:hypothetical protein
MVGRPVIQLRCEVVGPCERIASLPLHSLAGFGVKYRALVWQLVEDDMILDRGLRRQVLAFGRELDALAARSHV